MPGVAFPPVGPWDVGSPPSRPEAQGSRPSVLWSAKTAKSPSRGRSVLPVLPRYLVSLVLLCVPCASQGSSERREPPLQRRESLPHWSALLRLILYKETIGSPTFPSHPSACMPRSQTPVVSCTLALAHPGLLPSGHCTPSAFPRCGLRTILWTTTLHISGLHHAACILVPSSFVRPLLGVHVDCTPDLLARR